MMDYSKLSTAAIVAGLTAVILMALGAVLYVAPGEESTQRLGLFFGIAGLTVTALVGLLRSDQAKTQTNGMASEALNKQIQDGILVALAARRATDTITVTPDAAPTVPVAETPTPTGS